MAHSPSLKLLCLALPLLYFASTCCQAQDAIQIVARAALCFDNRPVLNNCLTSMGISTNGTVTSGNNGTTTSGNNGKNNSSTTNTIFGGSPGPKQKRNATSVFCGSPCYGQMMMMAGCVDGIMSSFQFYSPGLLQGVQAIFQMACRGNNGSTAANSTASSSSSHVSRGSNSTTADTTALSSSHAADRDVEASNRGNVIVKPILMYLLILLHFIY